MKWSLGLGLFHSAQVTRNVELTSGAAGQSGGGAHCVDYARIMETPSLFQGSEVHRWNMNPRPQPQTFSILVFLT